MKFCLLLLFIPFIISAQVYPDTIYYNSVWQICERSRADFYRLCSVKTEPAWLFTGKVKDFYMDGTLQMEGNYSSEGFRDGNFIFYYSNGKIEAQGRFVKDRLYGNWIFNYPDETKKAKLYYSGDALFFILIDYIDEKGSYLVKDGTGKFTIPVIDIYSDTGYLFTGEFINGEREGSWEYRLHDKTNGIDIKHREIYKEGKFKRGESFVGDRSYREFKKPDIAATFISYKKFKNTEEFAVSNESAKVDMILNSRLNTPSNNSVYGNTRDTVGAMTKVEIEASFPGGRPAWRKFLEQNLRAEILTNTLPASIKNYTQTVQVRFIVCEDGTVCNVEVANKDEGFKPVQQEAARVITLSGKWMPAVHEGKYVKSFHTQPITFVATSE